MYEKLVEQGISKPLITAYLPSYNPENDPAERVLTPWKIDFKEITVDKQVLFVPSCVNNFKSLEGPIEAKFYSAHFTFTSGRFVLEVPHDPELYFTGEEMSITVRAWTYGYTLFHPHILIAWHEYTRKNRVKQWDDDKVWWKKDLHSKKHYLNIFNNFGLYGIGKVRTVKEYIKFSGINFLNLDMDDCVEKENNKDESYNNTISYNKNDENDEKDEKDKKDKIYKIFDESWINWIKENIDLGVPIQEIKKILLKANFNPTDIEDKTKIIH